MTELTKFLKSSPTINRLSEKSKSNGMYSVHCLLYINLYVMYINLNVLYINLYVIYINLYVIYINLYVNFCKTQLIKVFSGWYRWKYQSKLKSSC